MDIAKKFGTDKSAEENGVWIDIGDGAKIKVARLGNRYYKEAFKQKTKPYNKRMDSIPEDIAEKILIEAMVEGILLDWQGFLIDGVSYPYNKQNAFNILQKYNDFRDLVISHASEIENYKKEELKEKEKNLLTPSAGISSGAAIASF